MPRYPSLSTPAQSLPPSVFDQLMRRLLAYSGQVIPLHIGDTHLAPPVASRLGALGFTSDEDPDMYRYSPAPGKPQLVEALVRKVGLENGLTWAAHDNVQVTAGATHALSCVARAVLDPGDHMLLLAPYWPLIRGISLSSGVRPVEVPFSHLLLRDPSLDAEELIERYVTPSTTALYICSPNNPDGRVMTESDLAAIARVAERHDLWVLADEVYEDLLYDGREHHSLAALPGMADRTFTVYSFSKSYGHAGLRVGYVVGPRAAIAAVRKMSNHTIYCVPRAMQRAARVALETGETFLAAARTTYCEARDLSYERLSSLCLRPEGATYLWLDLDRFRRPGEEDAVGVLGRMADAGVLLAPGAAFGQTFRSWARLCFTSVGRAGLEEGLDRVCRVLDAT